MLRLTETTLRHNMLSTAGAETTQPEAAGGFDTMPY